MKTRVAARSIPELEQELVDASTPPVDPIRRVDALVSLAWELRTKEVKEVSRGHRLASEARELAVQHHYKLGQARAVRTMAMTIGDFSSLPLMFHLAEEAKQLFDEVGDAAGRAGSRDFLATLHEFTGDLAAALELALDALAIARELGDPVRQGYALSNIGGILAASEQNAAAVERLEEALQLFRSVEDLSGEGQIGMRLAKVLKASGRTDEARRHAIRCGEIGKLLNNDWLDWSAVTVMAQLAELRGENVAAEQLYRDALSRLATPLARDLMGPETQVALGRLLLKQGACTAAETELLDALRRVQDVPVSIVLETAVHEALADVYERLGNDKATIKHLRRAQTLKEQVAQKNARNKLAQVKVRDAIAAAKQDAERHKQRFVELHGTQSKRVETEKMAILARLAAGTAHELNTPLGVLSSNAQLVATAAERLQSLFSQQDNIGAAAARLASVLAACAKTSGEAMKRIASIAESYKRFAELDQADRRSFNVADSMASALALLEPTVPERITVERQFEPVPSVEGWPRELNHAFMTVLQNAVQAIDGPGLIVVRTHATSETLLVSVRDTGRGMSHEQTARLFDVTWSEGGARTEMRLGLSAAYAAMQKHRGTMDVASAVGEGTTVTFRFPLAV